MQVSNECLNKEGTIWGLKYVGLLMSVIVGIIFLCKYRFYIALISLFPGYFIGSWISAKLLPGNIQRWLYRNLPSKHIIWWQRKSHHHGVTRFL